MRAAKFTWFLVALALCAGFFSLGLWQWQRGADKEALQARLTLAQVQPPVALDEALQRGDQTRYSRVWVRGQLRQPSVYLDNQIRDGRVGVLVANRLQLEPDRGDQGGADLLVIRGWRPLDDGVRALPAPQVPAEILAIQGFLDRPPAAGLSLGAAPGADADSDPLLVTRIDLDWLAQRDGKALLPWVLYLHADSPAGYLRDWQPSYLPPERHRGYAVQWWGLAAATIVVYLVLLIRQQRPKHGKT